MKSYKNYILESLVVSDNFYYILEYLSSKKNNKVAKYLLLLKDSDAYPSDELMNTLSTHAQDNLLSFLQYDRLKKMQSDPNHNYEEKFTSNLRSTIRVGRAVNKIVDIMKNNSNFSFNGKCRVFCDRYNHRTILIESKDIDYTKFKKTLIIDPNDDPNDSFSLPGTKITLKLNNDDFSNEIDAVYVSENMSIGAVVSRENYLKAKLTYPTIDGSYATEVYPASEERRNFREPAKEVPKDSIPYDINCNFLIENAIEITPSDIELFTNEYISLMRLNKADVSSKILEVRGEEIKKWYSSDNYQTTIGKLGNSCMADPSVSDYFDIYSENPGVVSLLILKNKEGKLVGRSLLWNTDIGFFMDRCYTINDYDENIFINYAIKNGYLYRSPSVHKLFFKDGKKIESPVMIVRLQNYDFEYYPYLDTFMYLDMTKGTLTNKEGNHNYDDDHDYEYDSDYRDNDSEISILSDTGGGWSD
jgi:hypothetical protein